jgi:hypothetical protein
MKSFVEVNGFYSMMSHPVIESMNNDLLAWWSIFVEQCQLDVMMMMMVVS